MKIGLFLLICSLFHILSTCELNLDRLNSGYWKLTAKEYWWATRNDSNQNTADLVKVKSFPSGKWFHVQGYSYYIDASDHGLTCKDSAHSDGNTSSLRFGWNSFPQTVHPLSHINISGQVTRASGKSGGSMVISHPHDYTIGHPSFTEDWALYTSANAGLFSANVIIGEPLNVNKVPNRAILVSIICSYAQIDYIYIYEWINE